MIQKWIDHLWPRPLAFRYSITVLSPGTLERAIILRRDRCDLRSSQVDVMQMRDKSPSGAIVLFPRAWDALSTWPFLRHPIDVAVAPRRISRRDIPRLSKWCIGSAHVHTCIRMRKIHACVCTRNSFRLHRVPALSSHSRFFFLSYLSLSLRLSRSSVSVCVELRHVEITVITRRVQKA